MKAPAKRAFSLFRRSARVAGKSCIHCFYSIAVILLAAVTAFAAYVATLESIPIPGFLLRQIRDAFDKQGIALHLREVQIRPNGIVTITGPEVYSVELGSVIAKAQTIRAKINLPRLLIGRVALDDLIVSDGSVILPPMLTPSGLPETAFDSIDLRAHRGSGVWHLKYANLALGDLKLCVDGPLKQRFLKLPPPKPKEERKTIAQQIAALAPRIFQARQQIAQFAQPACTIELGIDESRFQTATLRALFNAGKFADDKRVGPTLAIVDFHETSGLRLAADLQKLDLPKSSSVQNVLLQTSWDQLPNKEDFLPAEAQLSLGGIRMGDFHLPALLLEVAPTPQRILGQLQFNIGDVPFDLRFDRDAESGKIAFDLDAVLGPEAPKELTPLIANFAKLDLTKHATIGQSVDLSLRGVIGKDRKPQRIDIWAQTGSMVLLGAAIDRSTITGVVEGPQIDINKIFIRSGPQSADIGVHFNTQSYFRRILVEGNVDPNLINGWFKPWWTAMWDGMVFSPRGLYISMDSQGTFLKPDTVYVTGIGLAHDMDLRGIPVDDLRLRFFSLFRYVDLYDIELQAKTGETAFGNAQFYLDRDLRDDKDKLVALWIDVDSTLDVMRGPSALPEIRKDTEEILAPYSYDKIPHIVARSSSIRHRDVNLYNIDLDIQTDAPFRYYGFPFGSLETFVHLQNGVAEIPNARAKLADGIIEASAFILGDGIDLDIKLKDASFAQTLVATNTYFAANGSETAKNNDPSKFLEYGGALNASFQGSGIAGDPLLYRGKGAFEITDANLVERRLLGPLSAALEVTPLAFTTLKFDEASGPFTIRERYVHFSDVDLDGPMAKMKLEGKYDLATDELDFKARLFPFLNTNIPLVSTIINITTQLIFSVIELSIKGTFDDPKVSLFNGTPSDRNLQNPRDSRPQRK